MAGAERPRPKIGVLIWLVHARPWALAIDWRAAYGRAWQPLTMRVWRDGVTRARIGAGTAWDMTREILRDPGTHSYAALAGWTHMPGQAEQVAWALGDHKRGEMPPWQSQDPLASRRAQPRSRQLEDRERLKRLWHIND